MSKTLGPKDNYRVEVTAEYWGPSPGSKNFNRGYFEADQQSDCEKIADQIRRHVDKLESVVVRFDQESVCEHCGRVWTEDGADYNGGCCDKDQEAQEARESAGATP